MDMRFNAIQLFIGLFLLAIIPDLSAQSPLPYSKKWGSELGLNYTDYYLRDPSGNPSHGINSKPKPGISLAVNYNSKIFNKLEYELQLHFLRQANSLEEFNSGHFFGGRTEGVFILDYINVAFFPQVSFGEKIQLHLQVGPSIGLLTNSARKTEITYRAWSLQTGETLFNQAVMQNGDFFKSYYIGIVTGLGLLYPLNEHLYVKMKFVYDLGLNNISQPALSSSESVYAIRKILYLGVTVNI